MLISLNELKSLVKIGVSDDELFQLIGSRLVEIEHVHDLTPKYKKIYVVKVKKAEPIEGTHLHLCEIDAGKELSSTIDPEHDDFIQVVCGAPNVKKGMLTAWVAPGATVPSTYGTPEPFEISARPLRGFMSYGMLAAKDELDLGPDHDGIIELDPRAAQPGQLLADVLDLNDKIIEVENKSLTHRPDCFGIWGFAREVAGVLGQKFNEPKPLSPQNKITCHSNKTITTPKINIVDRAICQQYYCAVYDFSKMPQTRSPYFTKDDVFLVKAGMHPISPIVDCTNKIMLLTGQPLHAFDYHKFVMEGVQDPAFESQKLEVPQITIRNGRKDDPILTLLDGKVVQLTENDIVICSYDRPVALAGAMGGQSTAIDADTKLIILESATFSLYNLRKTQMAHGIFSEAITRFTKGIPASLNLPAIAQFSEEIGVLPETIDGDLSTAEAQSVVNLSVKDINALLGSNYSLELIKKTLENTGFKVEVARDDSPAINLRVTTPLWRTDIHIKEDIIEEVGRLLGFDNLPLDFPKRPFVCPTVDPILDFKSQLRTVLSDRLGMNEILTYSFVSKSLQEKAGEDPDDSYQIVNSISPDLECFRQSLLPSLLDKMHTNEKAGYKDFSLYELNQVSKKSWGLTEENVPVMQTELALVSFQDFYGAKHVLHELEKSLGLHFDLKPLDSSSLFEPLHSVAIFLNDEKVGELGEVKGAVQKRFKLSRICSALHLSLDPCLGAKNTRKFGVKLSKFPYVSRDLTFRVSKDTSYASIEAAIKDTLSQIKAILYILEPVSIFRKGHEATKNLSFHLELASTEKTLDGKEISDIIDLIVKHLSALGAEVV